MESEVNGSYDLMTEKLGGPPSCFVFPNEDAMDTPGIKKVLERHKFIVHHDTLNKVYDRVFLPYYGGKILNPEIAAQVLDFSIANHVWVIPMIHTVRRDEQWAMHRPLSFQFFKKHLSDVHKREDQLWVDVAGNVYRYLVERNGTAIHVEERTENKIVFSLQNELDPDFYSVPLTIVINAAPVHPHKATAWQQDIPRQSLPVSIHGDNIYVNVVPPTGSIRVEWE